MKYLQFLLATIAKRSKSHIMILSAAGAVVCVLLLASIGICRSIQSRYPIKPAVAVPGSSVSASSKLQESSGVGWEGTVKPPESSIRDSGVGSRGTVYMTFDDGPSDLTEPLLDVLDQYHVKATFFVVGKDDRQGMQEMKDIVNRGHTIGVHSYTHDYRKIYASTDAFFQDFNKMHDLILKATGLNTKICRFAGGSVNAYDRRIRKSIIQKLSSEGYVYYDWNVSSGDSATKTNSDLIFHNAIDGVHRHKTSVVLFHNSGRKSDTLKQVPKFIETLESEGYCFRKLDPSISNLPFIFR